MKDTENNNFNISKLPISAFLYHNEGFAVLFLKYMDLKLNMHNFASLREGNYIDAILSCLEKKENSVLYYKGASGINAASLRS